MRSASSSMDEDLRFHAPSFSMHCAVRPVKKIGGWGATKPATLAANSYQVSVLGCMSIDPTSAAIIALSWTKCKIPAVYSRASAYGAVCWASATGPDHLQPAASGCGGFVRIGCYGNLIRQPKDQHPKGDGSPSNSCPASEAKEHGAEKDSDGCYASPDHRPTG